MKMKDSGVEWIGEIPEDWEIISSKYLFSERKGKMKSGDVQLTASQKYGMIPQQLFMKFAKQKPVALDKNFENFKHVDKGDFVISLRSFQGGIEFSEYTGAVSPAYTVIIPKSRKIYRPYYRWLFKNIAYIQAIGATSDSLRDGKSLKWSNFILVDVPVPKLSEQQKIANFLDSKIALIDQIIADTKRSIEELKAYKQSLITEVVTKGLKHSTDFSIYLTKIKYIAEIDPPYDEKIDENELATFLPMDRLKNGYLINDTQKSIKELKNKYSYFADGDIIIAKVRPSFENGNLALASGLENGLGFGTTEIYTIRNKKTKNFSSRYLAYYLRNTDFINQGSSTMTGVAGLKRISAQFIQNYHIPKISFEEGETIADFLDGKIKNIDGLIYEKFNLINEYESYKKSLIYEYVTGKKQVNK
ncbi:MULTISPECIES: restriction endonuclease subunit S [Lactococcus]|uniref:restriction endonuclease subunit S n=2 Tax=Streptococcaceae TaxID=1300 RepID=UPI00203AC9C4|nr:MULTISPECIES: restriction endonuclease subunit S [Lactococcus]